ncbi:MAG TPA: cytochrome c biogenesis protein CcsA [Burkholderiaceae bacterium]|nr:cytochrome c biogenesis protein CcsA [Burkholderiaceae bacterium]
MQLRFEWLALYVAVAALYLLVAWREWAGLRLTAARVPFWLGAVLILALILHGALLLHGMYQGEQLRFGFAHALSATLWITALIVCVETLFTASRGMFLLVLPLTALASFLPVLYPGAIVGRSSASPLFQVHLLLAILAYSLLTIAAIHALLMATMERRLHGEAVVAPGRLASVIDRLPPLLAMEGVLFRLITVGFVLLTATLVTGIFFSEELFGRPLRFDHKTVFAIAAWIVFGGLLLGRLVFGWRGRTALRWTITGFAMLMLAYVGSHFVLEVLLQRV